MLHNRHTARWTDSLISAVTNTKSRVIGKTYIDWIEQTVQIRHERRVTGIDHYISTATFLRRTGY